MFVHYFIVRNKSKKSSDTSGKPKPRLAIFYEKDQKKITLSTQEKEFSTSLSCVEDEEDK